MGPEECHAPNFNLFWVHPALLLVPIQWHKKLIQTRLLDMSFLTILIGKVRVF